MDPRFEFQKKAAVFGVVLRDGQIFVLNDVSRGQDRGEEPHAIANVVKVLSGSELFAAGPGGPAIFFYLSEVSDVRDPITNDVLCVGS